MMLQDALILLLDKITYAWVEGSKGMAARGVSPQHVVTPNEIIVNGTNALAISTCLVMTRFEMEGAEFDINALFRIVARAVKIGNDWKLRTLNCIYVQDSIQPAIPRVGDHVNFDLSIVADARKSYRALCWSIARKGGKPNLDMMGEDNPQEAEDFMMQMYSWIENPAW